MPMSKWLHLHEPVVRGRDGDMGGYRREVSCVEPWCEQPQASVDGLCLSCLEKVAPRVMALDAEQRARWDSIASEGLTDAVLTLWRQHHRRQP